LELLGRVVRTDALVGDRIGHAYRRLPVAHRDALGARERSEVMIERAVLLDDEHQVLEVRLGLLELRLFRPGRRRPGQARRAGRGGACLGRAAGSTATKTNATGSGLGRAVCERMGARGYQEGPVRAGPAPASSWRTGRG